MTRINSVKEFKFSPETNKKPEKRKIETAVVSTRASASNLQALFSPKASHARPMTFSASDFASLK